MSRGRPTGSGKRWSEHQDCSLWARLTLIRETEAVDLRRACNALARRGLWQAQNGKYWLSNPAKVQTDPRLPPLMVDLRPGDSRNDDPAETFRQRYYAAERRRRGHSEAARAFRAECDFWLAVFRRARDLRQEGVDPQQAMWQAHSETPFTPE